LFQRRQRADAVTELDGRRPQDRWQVQGGSPFPAQEQKAAEDDEQYEAEMQQDNAVGKDAFDHGAFGKRWSGLHCFTPAAFMHRPEAAFPPDADKRLA
jgi:hypothetical protein